MPTALDVIRDSFEMLGVYDPGTAPTDADAERGLTALNDMIDSWSNESLTTFATTTINFPLVPGTSSYTIGSGGTISTTRPIRILGDPGLTFVRDTNGNDFDIEVIGQDEWDRIETPADQSQYPEVLFYDPQYPLGIVNLWPVPNMAFTAFFTVYAPLADLTNLAAQIALPPGYKLAMVTNLAIALHPYFLDGPINPVIVERAKDSKANIKRSNMKPLIATFDSEIVSKGSSAYDVYTDSARR